MRAIDEIKQIKQLWKKEMNFDDEMNKNHNNNLQNCTIDFSKLDLGQQKKLSRKKINSKKKPVL